MSSSTTSVDPVSTSERDDALSRAAADHAARELLARAGVRNDEVERIDGGWRAAGVTLLRRMRKEATGRQIRIASTTEERWARLRRGEAPRVTRVPIEKLAPPGARLPFDDLPVFLAPRERAGTGDRPWFDQPGADRVELHFDLLAMTHWFLACVGETGASRLDEHGRVPGAKSVLEQCALLERPVVDEYGHLLRSWIERLSPRWSARRESFGVRPSHDVDHLKDFTGWRHFARTLAGDCVKRHSASGAWHTVSDFFRQRARPRDAGSVESLFSLARLSGELGLGPSSFYFLAGHPSPLDGDYDLDDSLASTCVRRLQECGQEIGLHGSYASFDDPDRLARERQRLAGLLGRDDFGCRQHFLRLRTPRTWRDQVNAGLRHDATLGFADREGFRAGTCRPFQAFDRERDEPLPLEVRPLIAMDVTLFRYRGLGAADVVRRVLELADHCRRVDGQMSLLWHNASPHRERAHWWKAYLEIATTLAQWV